MDRETPDSGLAAPELSVFPRRTRELFHYLVSTFVTMLPPDKAAQFSRLAEKLDGAIDENCQNCGLSQHPPAAPGRDPRRRRFLLRLVVSRVSPLFAGDKATMPRSLIEGLDRYLVKAFGPIIYDELNAEADHLLYSLNVDDDKEMWEHIRKNPQWRQFVDTIFIRILFRFENFATGKNTFMNILDRTMQESSHFTFRDDHFFAVFESLFAHTWNELQKEDQRIRWDFMFGDGTSKRLTNILRQGLVRYLKPEGTTKRRAHGKG